MSALAELGEDTGSSSTMSRVRNAIGRNSLRLALLIILLGSWELLATLAPEPYLPSLLDIADAYSRLWRPPLLTEHVAASVMRVIVGLLIGSGIGAIVGVLLGNLRWLDEWLNLILEFLRGLPVVAILPAALLILGATDTMRIAVIALGSLFPVLLSAMDGARRIDPLWTESARSVGLSRLEILTKVSLPGALPQMFAGFKISLGIALIMMVVSELMAASSGLGHFIQRNQRLFLAANVYAGVLMIGTIAWFLSTLVLSIERRLLFWQRGQLGRTLEN